MSGPLKRASTAIRKRYCSGGSGNGSESSVERLEQGVNGSEGQGPCEGGADGCVVLKVLTAASTALKGASAALKDRAFKGGTSGSAALREGFETLNEH